MYSSMSMQPLKCCWSSFRSACRYYVETHTRQADRQILFLVVITARMMTSTVTSYALKVIANSHLPTRSTRRSAPSVWIVYDLLYSVVFILVLLLPLTVHAKVRCVAWRNDHVLFVWQAVGRLDDRCQGLGDDISWSVTSDARSRRRPVRQQRNPRAVQPEAESDRRVSSIDSRLRPRRLAHNAYLVFIAEH